MIIKPLSIFFKVNGSKFTNRNSSFKINEYTHQKIFRISGLEEDKIYKLMVLRINNHNFSLS